MAKGRRIQFTTVCAWCGKTLRREQVWRDDPNAPDETSHGICAACERELFEGEKKKEKK